MEEAVPSGRPREVGYIPWHLLYFHPEPHGHRSFRPTFEASAGAANGPARERRCSRFITDCSRSFNCFPAAKSCSTCHSTMATPVLGSSTIAGRRAGGHRVGAYNIILPCQVHTNDAF